MNANKDKGIAIVGTIIVHALVVLLLFLMAFRTPLPLPGEEGVEVDLGMSNQGMGEVQPLQSAIPEQNMAQTQPQKADEDIATQDTEEAPAIEKKKENKTKPEEAKPIEKPQPKVNQKALFKGNSNAQKGGSEGITGQPGDQGNPNGLAGIKQYEGTGGSGNGTGYSLGGRGAKKLQRPNEDFNEEGHIVVDIWVNREGKVVRAEIATKGTDIVNSEMRSKAKAAALQSVFASDPNAPAEQKGTITYTFVLKQ
ncbi:MAG: hypothetical protein MJZ91_11000 [Bacteroidales bacterium]|nr:hypothetical protein [Bacteroidales bacterium]